MATEKKDDLAARERMYMDPTKLEDEENARKAAAPKGLSQADIDKMSYGEAFKHFRGQGSGTKFTWRGSKQAAYRKGEEPESFKKSAVAPKSAAPKTETPRLVAPRVAAGPTKEKAASATATAATNATRNNRTSSDVATRMRQAEADWRAAKGKPTPSLRQVTAADVPNVRYNPSAFERGLNMDPSIRAITGMAKGGSVESKNMVKKEIGFMKKKGAPKSMIKHEMAEAKGMKCGGMAKYAGGGGVAPSGVRPGSPSASRINRGPVGSVSVSPVGSSTLTRSIASGAANPIRTLRDIMPTSPPPRGNVEVEDVPMARGGKVAKMARGGGIESKGKTKGSMIKMASGGSVSARADGIATKGKTNCKIC